MEPDAPSYLERLQSWMSRYAIELDRTSAENRWMSIPLPTRRFGPDGWVVFAMKAGGSATVGPFAAWIVIDSESPRVIAYLEPPLADTFGVVDAFELDGTGLGDLPPDLVRRLSLAGEAFLRREPARREDASTIDEVLGLLGDGVANALEASAIDFFRWARQPKSESDDVGSTGS